VKLSTLTVFLGAAFVAPFARADGGYYGGALGARAAGRSGAFVARADDPTAVAYNPAGLAQIEGTMVMVGNRVSYNGYSYTRAPTLDWGHPMANGDPTPVSFAQVSNSRPWQALEPLFAVASNLGQHDWGFAIAAFASPGVSREDFPLDGGQRYMMLSREAIFLNYAVSAAWKHHDVFGVGATFEWVHVPRLNYSLIINGSPFANEGNAVSSGLDMIANTSGSDPFTANAIVGAWARPRPYLQFGLAGQVIPARVVTNSKLEATPLDASMGTLVLTRNYLPANDVNVVLPLPLTVRAGGRYRGLAGAREVFDVELDVEYETWSRVNQFTVETHGLIGTIRGTDVEIKDIHVPKQWRDTVAVKLGGDWAVVPERVALRAGAFYESAVSEAAYSNVDFPGGQMLGGSVGGSVRFGSWEIAAAYQFRYQPEVTVSEADGRVYQQLPVGSCKPPYTDPATCNPHYNIPNGLPGPVVNAGTYNAASHLMSLAIVYRYGAPKENP
jgi:long-chain fatty acid transport protein